LSNAINQIKSNQSINQSIVAHCCLDAQACTLGRVMQIHALHIGLTMDVVSTPTVAMFCAVKLPRLESFSLVIEAL